jgi:hypothetical protein
MREERSYTLDNRSEHSAFESSWAMTWHRIVSGATTCGPSSYVPLRRVTRISASWCEVMSDSCSDREGFQVSRLEGQFNA